MFRFIRSGNLAACITAFGAAVLATNAAIAEYTFSGSGMQTVSNGTVLNSAIYCQSNTLWNASGGHSTTSDSATPYVVTTSFATPACDSVTTSRLVLTVWGGNPSLVGGLAVTVNNTSIADLSVGGTGDSNQTFSSTGINVYGSGSGVWFISIPVTSSLLYTDGTANQVTISLSDTVLTDGVCFDGRIAQATLWSVYQDSSLHNTFQYVVAEGSGDIYKTSTYTSSGKTYTTTMSREVSLGTANTDNVTSATFTALYTYGDKNQNDHVSLNGTQLGGDDVANKQNGSSLAVAPDLVSFGVTNCLSSTNTVTFSVDPEDVPSSQEVSLRPELAILAITSAPEPGTLALLGVAMTAILLRAARRAQQPR
ncbi:MAG: PEP-CTERM sorting domain-containing protein [Thermoguttaceae bacterium]